MIEQKAGLLGDDDLEIFQGNIFIDDKIMSTCELNGKETHRQERG